MRISSFGRLASEFIQSTVGDAIKHHENEYDLDILGLTFWVQEKAYGVGHEMKITVIASPDDKINNVSTGILRGKHADDARALCIRKLTLEVKKKYHL